MNILNIDIEDNRRKWIYKRINRLENVVHEGCRQICRENTDSYELCSNTETEWGDLLKESLMPGAFGIDKVDVLLIHHSPRQPFWSDYITFLKEKTSNQRWLSIIYYSGGDDLSNKNDFVNEENKIKECFFRYPLGDEDEDKFFIDKFLHEVIQKSESIDCSVLWLNYVSEAHRLRYEILSPLVALDLINQAEENNKNISIDEKMKDAVKEAIRGLTKNNEKQKKNSIEALCDHIQCDSFRSKLEKLVIDGSSSLKIDRNDLEDIAKRMEEQIARL